MSKKQKLPDWVSCPHDQWNKCSKCMNKQSGWEVGKLIRRGLGIEHIQHLPSKIYIEPESVARWIEHHMAKLLSHAKTQGALEMIEKVDAIIYSSRNELVVREQWETFRSQLKQQMEGEK